MWCSHSENAYKSSKMYDLFYGIYLKKLGQHYWYFKKGHMGTRKVLIYKSRRSSRFIIYTLEVSVCPLQEQNITKKMTILFFVYFGTHNNKIHTIYKQTSVFVFIFSMLKKWIFSPTNGWSQ
jgi:hypothetical protein